VASSSIFRKAIGAVLVAGGCCCIGFALFGLEAPFHVLATTGAALHIGLGSRGYETFGHDRMAGVAVITAALALAGAFRQGWSGALAGVLAGGLIVMGRLVLPRPHGEPPS